jgi:uncharacterized membrane protein YeaQ/YmgE (transglycosylase-associated protein family)
MITYLILLVFSGLIVGALGRLAIPGPDPMGIGATILIGIAGSILGGLVGVLLLGRPGGMVLAVLGAALIVYGIRRARGGTLDRPHGDRPRHGGRSVFGR